MKKSDPGEGKAQKKDKKEKKEKKEGAAEAGEGKKKAAGGGKAAPAEDAGEPVPSMIDLRVGHIVDGMWFLPSIPSLHLTRYSVKKHPDADGLYVEVTSPSNKHDNFPHLSLSDISANRFRRGNRSSHRCVWACELCPNRENARQMACRCCASTISFFKFCDVRLRRISVQLEACQHAWSQKLCHGSLRTPLIRI